jgi:hypothetical protein
LQAHNLTTAEAQELLKIFTLQLPIDLYETALNTINSALGSKIDHTSLNLMPLGNF